MSVTRIIHADNSIILSIIIWAALEKQTRKSLDVSFTNGEANVKKLTSSKYSNNAWYNCRLVVYNTFIWSLSGNL